MLYSQAVILPVAVCNVLDFKSGSIHGNTALKGTSALGIRGKVTLGSENGSVSIYENIDKASGADANPCAVHLMNKDGDDEKTELNIYKATIYGNTDKNENPRDLYIDDDRVINVTGDLTGCYSNYYLSLFFSGFVP